MKAPCERHSATRVYAARREKLEVFTLAMVALFLTIAIATVGSIGWGARPPAARPTAIAAGPASVPSGSVLAGSAADTATALFQANPANVSGNVNPTTPSGVGPMRADGGVQNAAVSGFDANAGWRALR